MSQARGISQKVCCLLTACVLLAGCSQNHQALLSPAINPPIADVPVPSGFRIDLSRSQATVVPNSNLRMVNQFYKGSDPRLSVARFFMHYMPTDGWNMLQETQGPQGIILSFKNKKNRENCTVTVKRGWFHTHLYIVIAPGGRAGAATTPSAAAPP
ncbi:MAG: hypothetical protein M1588_03535 [Planctomycetes bacterium]|jgi:hypothetical protein|nr:hypothetical protein [Planctomycetota bacterium]